MEDMTTTQWRVDVLLGEREGHTHAKAMLHTHDDTHLVGTGLARLRPSERDVPEIGEEIAAARALIDLAHQLLHAAADDIEGVTSEAVTLDQ